MRRVLLSLMWCFPLLLNAADDAWVVGQWRQVYDPEHSDADTLEFHANGDMVSRGHAGVYNGFYMVAPGVVKAVLSVGNKDLILTFFHNDAKDQLRIVTSDTGVETVYQKIGGQ